MLTPMHRSQTELPSGVVTFAFTDIEGSTRLFKRLGDEAYPSLLERHYAILRGVWSRHGGAEIGTEGDGFLVAFGQARDAALACLEAQHRIASEPWIGGTELRVRMGLHMGIAYPRAGGYIALAVHQTARVVAAAHGGQIVASERVAAAVAGVAGLVVQPLGRFRLRDFEAPVDLHQISAPGLRSSFPAVRALPADKHNIPAPVDSLIGRAADLRAIASLLATARLVTLVGPGGVGKTRLASEYGRRSADRWPGGVWMVRLEELREGAPIVNHVAAAMGLSEDIGEPGQLADGLRTTRALLALDNCEHVVDEVAGMVDLLLGECREMSVLTTSREPLEVSGERIWRVAPLGVGHPGATSPGSDAVLLFEQRAREVRADFAVCEERTRLAVETICSQVDGLPLAIELAARSLGSRTVDEVASGLEESLELPARRRGSASRHRSLQAVLDWSYELLSDDERTALRALGIFSASFGLDGARAALTALGVPQSKVPDLVFCLAEKSLVNLDESLNATRYRMMRTVRTYAHERTGEAESDVVARAVVAWYQATIGAGVLRDRAWVEAMRLEIQNVRGVIPRCPADARRCAQELAAAVGSYHVALGNFATAESELRSLAEKLPEHSPELCELLGMLAHVSEWLGDVDGAEGWCERAETVRRQTGEVEWSGGRVPSVRVLISLQRGDLDAAVRIASEATARALGDEALGRAWNTMGIVEGELGRLRSSRESFERALLLTERSGDHAASARIVGNLAETAFREGSLDLAARYQLDCLSRLAELGEAGALGLSLELAARIAQERGEWIPATRLLGRALRILEESGEALLQTDARLSEGARGRLVEELGRETFDLESEAGAHLRVEDAIELARAVLGRAGR